MSNDAFKAARDKYLALHKPEQREALTKAWLKMFPEASKLLAKLPPIPVTSETFERQYMGTFATPEPEPPSPTGRGRRAHNAFKFAAALEDLKGAMHAHDDMVDATTIAFRATKPPPTPPEAFAARMKKLRTREE